MRWPPHLEYRYGARPAFKGTGVEDGVVSTTQDGGQRCDAQHDDQNSVGGVHQRFLQRGRARTVHNRINNANVTPSRNNQTEFLPSV